MTFDSIHDPTHFYFMTATTCGWKDLFAEHRYAMHVLNSLAYIRSQRVIWLGAFVLMPSHLHAVLRPRDRVIGQVLQTFGSFTAHRLLAEMRSDHRSDLVRFFHNHRRDRRHSHSVWQDIQAKNVASVEFLRQKLEYIHNNPIRHADCQTRNRADYPYSSACFYDRGETPIIPVDDLRSIM
jgi:putative transposase